MTEFSSLYEMHGLAGRKSWKEPTLVTRCDKANRADQGNTTKANEYLDDAEVLDKKMEKIAKLIRKSKYTVAYTGAGLSKASGIPDYATKAENSIVNFPKIKSSLDAYPTYSHHVLKRLSDADLLHYWVQQNHDGLPQKAGFPQEKINEIHGAWFDPSNRVVQFSGSLRTDLFEEMLEVEDKAQLCLCLGTSLSGMNADRVAKTPAKKYAKGSKKSYGTIIINLQKTNLDSRCTVRVWAKLDDAFEILAKKLAIDHSPPNYPFATPSFPNDQKVFWVPYNEEGKLDRKSLMKLDLSDEQLVVICSPGASNEGSEGVIYKRKDEINWTVGLTEGGKKRYYAYGWWMIDAATRGVLPYLPLRNLFPEVIPVTEDSKPDSNDR